MTCDRQIGEKKTASGERINPRQHSLDGCRFVNSETGLMVAANVAGVFQEIVAAVLIDRFHAQVHEAASG